MYPGAVAIFIAGVIAMGYLVVGLFFLRFWHRTGDRLFSMFALAFWLLAVNYAAFSLDGEAQQEPVWIYLIRLAAFIVIIAAVAAKNGRAAPRRRSRLPIAGKPE